MMYVVSDFDLEEGDGTYGRAAGTRKEVLRINRARIMGMMNLMGARRWEGTRIMGVACKNGVQVCPDEYSRRHWGRTLMRRRCRECTTR